MLSCVRKNQIVDSWHYTYSTGNLLLLFSIVYVYIVAVTQWYV